MRTHAHRTPLLAAATALALMGGLAVAAAPAAFADEVSSSGSTSVETPAEAAPPAAEPAPEPTSEPAVEPASEAPAPPAPEAITAPAPTPAAEPVPEPSAEPVSDVPAAAVPQALAEPTEDPNPPKVINTVPAPGAVYNAGTKVTVAFECVDPDDPIVYCGTHLHELGDEVTLEPGSYHWRFYANNARKQTITDVHFRVLPYDTTPPVVTIDAPAVPASGWYRSETDVVFTAADSSEVSYVLIELADGTTRNSVGPVLEHHFREGITVANVWAADHYNNKSAPIPIVVKVDSTAPTISVQTPAGPFEVGDDVDLDFSCADAASGVDECSAGSATGDKLDTRAPGDYAIDIRAEDRAGHLATSTFTYTVLAPDTEAPRVMLDMPAPNARGWYTHPVDALLWADDAEGRGVKSLDWKVTGPEPSSGSSELEQALRFAADGVHTITASASDSVGNDSGPSEFILRVDSTAPMIDDNTKLTFVQGAVADFSSLCTDATSGVAECGEPPVLAAAVWPTDTLGEHTVTIGAVDHAGNIATAEVTYEVIAAPAVEPDPTEPDPATGQPGTEHPVTEQPTGAHPQSTRTSQLASTGASAPIAAVLWAGLLLLLGAAGVIVMRRTTA
ncbi:hypothetical protein CLV46_0214 [Diaminobutyricimonas aerilata]|uniref:Ig-like domain-containing protein n=1 Tax=Diaminobutyricimonas aerilata TaxID=1162967 RepID=A0A2M9CFS0_9MICO|nr:hypothetical protein [Diaminobutyricimonas aerilata]PJJ70692.1 hypothetical protein CLV46_0214 [Diaminobutyricimonas aerilata]